MVDLSGKTVLVTGGNGFIGSNFIDYVLENYSDVKIFNIDKRGIGSRDIAKPKNNNIQYNELKSDLRELWHMPILTSANHYGPYDYVFHFAAESHVDRSINSPLEFISNNVIGMSSLLEYVRLHQSQARIINISTDEVFGHLNLKDPPFTEDSPIEPRSPYSASKASADLIAKAYHSTYNLDIITTRCCNNYGPWQHSEKFIPTVIRSINEGRKIPVYGNGLNIREWIHVDDHNKSILEICEMGKSGESYNIGSGKEKTNLQLIQDILGTLKVSGEKSLNDYIEFVDDRKGHDFRYALHSNLYNREFELTPYFKGLRETIQHYS
jgi:dTDP-glucose 4,6-dehydratase